jgi:hypothetical protein
MLLVFGGCIVRDAIKDRSPRAPQQQWWRTNRLVQPWYAQRHSKREHNRHLVRFPRRKVR